MSQHPLIPPPPETRASATLPNASRRQRANRRSNPSMTPTTMNEDDRLRAEWRTDVTRELERSAQAHQQTAVILERLSNRLDEHDRRLAALESAPQSEARERTERAGLSLQALYVGVAVCALVLSILSPHIAISLH